jgi:hypothetical protein
MLAVTVFAATTPRGRENGGIYTQIAQNFQNQEIRSALVPEKEFHISGICQKTFDRINKIGPQF